MTNTVRYELGMELALPTPNEPEPGGFTRESLLAGIVRQVAFVDDYELRLILHSDVPVDCPHNEVGEMVFVVAPGVGGPLRKPQAQPIIAEADAIGRSGELAGPLAPVIIGPALGAERTLILPPHCAAQLSTAGAGHPLADVALVPAVEVKKLLADLTVLDAAAHLARLVDFCMRTRVVISVCAARH